MTPRAPPAVHRAAAAHWWRRETPTWPRVATRVARFACPAPGAASTVSSRPKQGLIPYTGIFPIELTLDHTGPMTATVEDVALFLEATTGEDGLDPRQPRGVRGRPYGEALTGNAEGIRIGILAEGFG